MLHAREIVVDRHASTLAHAYACTARIVCTDSVYQLERYMSDSNFAARTYYLETPRVMTCVCVMRSRMYRRRIRSCCRSQHHLRQLVHCRDDDSQHGVSACLETRSVCFCGHMAE